MRLSLFSPWERLGHGDGRIGAAPLSQFLIVLMVAALAGSNALAQQTHRMGRLLVVDPCPPNNIFEVGDPLTEVLAERGWIQGQNLLIDCVSAAGRLSEISTLAAELVARKPEMLVTVSTPAIRALLAATTTIPIVMSTPDPVGEGYAQSLSRPGRNVTGLADFSLDLAGKRMDVTKELIPQLKRVAVLYRKGGDATFFGRLESQLNQAAATLGFEWHPFYHEGRPDDLEPLFSSMQQEGYELLYLVSSPFTFGNRFLIGKLALQYGLPIITEHPQFATAGALASLGVDADEQNRRLGLQVDRVLRGAKPESLPIEQPTKMHLVINLKTAKALHLTVPASLLTRADEVIE